MPAWTPAPPLSAHEMGNTSSALVLVGFPTEPPVQSRLTILFRIVLALPLLLWTGLLSIAAGVCVFLSWWAALFTGKVPPGLHDFVTSVVRYTTEVEAYVSVVAGRWPGFSLQPGDAQQVSMQINQFTLNRAAVFFRYFLSIPALMLGFIVTMGSYLLSIGTWLTALVLGRPAKPLFEARLLALRFTARYTAYAYLLTPTQPFSGFFGDNGVMPASDVAGVGIAASTTRLSTRLHLSTAGRILFILSFIVGAVGGVVYVTSFKKVIGRIMAPALLTGANQNVTQALDTFVAEFPHCTYSRDLTCARTDANTASAALTTQINTLRIFAGWVSSGKGAYNLYITDLTKVNLDLNNISFASSVSQQEAVFTNNLAADIPVMVADYQAARAAV